jgi:osmoprotectant transport system permease protein
VNEIVRCTRDHIVLTLISVGLATLIAMPGGVLLAKTRFRRLASTVLAVAAAIQTIPGLALLALIVTVFVLIGFVTLGMVPAVIALVLYALLPILRNTYTGIRQVDASTIEVAEGMGMTRRQILLAVELPLSIPMIMAGVRISTVWTIGIATLSSLVGAHGLGDLIFRGLRSYNSELLLAGTIPAAALALLADYLLGYVEKWLTPEGLRLLEIKG